MTRRTIEQGQVRCPKRFRFATTNAGRGAKLDFKETAGNWTPRRQFGTLHSTLVRSASGSPSRIKLWQFDPDDRTPVRIDTSDLSFLPAPDLPGIEFAVLYDCAWELVLLERWAPGISIAVPIPAGIELLVLDGGFTAGGEEFTQYSWLRLPAGRHYEPRPDRRVAASGSNRVTSRMSRGHPRRRKKPRDSLQACLSLFLRPDRNAPHAATVLGASAVLDGRRAISAERLP